MSSVREPRSCRSQLAPLARCLLCAAHSRAGGVGLQPNTHLPGLNEPWRALGPYARQLSSDPGKRHRARRKIGTIQSYNDRLRHGNFPSIARRAWRSASLSQCLSPGSQAPWGSRQRNSRHCHGLAADCLLHLERDPIDAELHRDVSPCGVRIWTALVGTRHEICGLRRRHVGCMQVE
jgi:hypothetical protein